MTNNTKWLNQFRLISLDEIDSTNNKAKLLSITDEPCSHTVIHADKQTAGRGRYGRKWESLDGNLFMSIILPKTASLEKMAQLCFVCGLATEAAITGIIQSYNQNLSTKLKWPNDVLVNDKKIAGILIETAGKNNEYIIVGIGVNIKAAPILQENKTTSLFAEGISFVTSKDLLNEIMTKFIKYYYIWLSEEFLPIRERWIKKAKGIGEVINVTTGHNRVSGKFIDIDFTGSIRVLLASGQIYSINAGEVFFSD